MKVSRVLVLLATVVALTLGQGAAATQSMSPSRLKEQMTAAQFERAGLHKLTAGELSALEAWLASAYRADVRSPNRLSAPAMGGAAAEIVMFNTATGKYHCASCQWAVRCTRNCTKMPLTQAQARGVACKVCRGSCT